MENNNVVENTIEASFEVLGDQTLEAVQVSNEPEVTEEEEAMADVASDPAAEFLAREQSALGDLDEDFAFAAEPSADDGFKADGLSDDGEAMTNGIVNGVNQLSVNGSDSGSSGPSSVPIIPAEEPESIKKWREQHKKAIQEKDEAEAEAIKALREQGKKELQDWYDRYAEQLEKTKQQNRTAEKEWIAEHDSAESGGQEWEKITKLCDFNPKTSHNTKDTSRMRSILLQVKQSPPPMPSQ